MLVSADRYLDKPVMSLQTGFELARTSRAVIDPRNLTIVAYELDGRLLNHSPSLLRIEDIREIGSLGMIIDSADEIVDPNDIIKLKETYDYQFELVQKNIIDDTKHKIGKVVGFTVEAGSFVIQQLRVKRPLFKSFGDTELLIHRSQVIKVTDDSIIVKSAKIAHHVVAETAISSSYENPFRKAPQPQSNASRS